MSGGLVPVLTLLVSRSAVTLNFFSQNFGDRIQEQLAIWLYIGQTTCLKRRRAHCSVFITIAKRWIIYLVCFLLFCATRLFPPGFLLLSTLLSSPWHQNGAQLATDVNRKRTTSRAAIGHLSLFTTNAKYYWLGTFAHVTFAFAVEVVEFQTHRSVLRLVGLRFVASSNQRVKGAAVSGFCGLYSVVVGGAFYYHGHGRWPCFQLSIMMIDLSIIYIC